MTSTDEDDVVLPDLSKFVVPEDHEATAGGTLGAFEAIDGNLSSLGGQSLPANEIEAHPRRPRAPVPQAPLSATLSPWPDPQPIRSEAPPERYPVEALPEYAREAVEDVQGFVQAPMAMVGTSALVMMAIAAQGRIDVARDSLLIGPVGLYALTLAESGERKSTVDGYFTRALSWYETDQRARMKKPLEEYASNMEAWDAVRSGIKTKIRALAKEKESTEDDERRLREHDERKPLRPRVPQIRLDDATPEGLGDKLVNEWPVVAILSDEGGTILGGYGMGQESVMRSISALNKAWDGKSVSAKRKVAESLPSISVRASMHVQVQPRVMQEFYHRAGDLTRGSGLFARFLMCCPESTQGTRWYREPPQGSEPLKAFEDRMYRALSTEVRLEDDGGCRPAVMQFSEAAKRLWHEFHDEIEGQLVAGGELDDVRESANKIADNAARLAAIFEFHERLLPSDSIDPSNFERAMQIVRWHLHEARRFFGELGTSEAEANAVRLDDWLRQECRARNVDRVPANEILRKGPSAVRKAAARDEALELLVELGRTRVDEASGTKCVLVNPSLIARG